MPRVSSKSRLIELTAYKRACFLYAVRIMTNFWKIINVHIVLNQIYTTFSSRYSYELQNFQIVDKMDQYKLMESPFLLSSLMG